MVHAIEGLTLAIPIVVLVSIRVAATLALMPQPFGALAPVQVRAVLGVMIAIAVTLPLRASLPEVHLDPLWLGFAALGELTVGTAIGLVGRGAMAAAEAAGEAIGNSMGLGFAAAMDPSSGEQSQLTTQLLGTVAALVFFVCDGHHVMIAGVAASLRAAPPGAALGAISPDALIALGAHVIEDGLRIASPIVATMLVVQIGVGLVARAAPRLQIFTLSFATAASVGLVALAASAPSMLEAIAGVIDDTPARLGELFSP